MNPQSAAGWRCHYCHDSGHVCENHTYAPWGPLCCDGPTVTVSITLPQTVTIPAPPPSCPPSQFDPIYDLPHRRTIYVYFGDVDGCIHGACHCSPFGEPCTACCSPVELFCEASIVTAFTPDWQRPKPEAGHEE